MIKFLSLLSILIYTTYSQCTNTHSQSTFLSVSVHGPSIDRIGGTDTYLQIIKDAALDIIPGGQNVGLQAFGGLTVNGVPTTSAWIEQSITAGDYSTLDPILTSLPTTHDFTENYGNDVTTALDNVIAETWTGQKYHVLFAAGIPLKNGFGTATKPENRDAPCTNAVRGKQNNIQTYVALIGTQGVNYVKQLYNCLVEDPTTDIIEIDPLNPTIGIANLKARVCKGNNGIDFKITEVNPIGGSYKSFIEVLNRGATVDIDVCFNANAATCARATVTTGNYFVGYNAGTAGNTPTGTVASGLGASAGSEGWTAIAKDSAALFTDSVAHTTGWQNQVKAPQTRSYALRAVGFNNAYGANWRSSCGTGGGTPGSAPLDICVSGTTCYAQTCGATPPGAEQCDTNDNYCQCSANYFSDADTCIAKPTVQTGGCQGYVIFDSVGNRDYTYFTYNLPYDGVVSYTVQYNKDTGFETKNTDSQSIAVDYLRDTELKGGSANLQVTAEVQSPVGAQKSIVQTSLTCAIATLEPTVSPTTHPTESPANNPTGTPTLNPTYDDPGCYISEKGGICSLPRCNCFQEVRTCCTPFGPRHGDTMTTGFKPTAGCENLFKSIEVTAAEQKTGKIEQIYVSKFGDTAQTKIYYRVTALGQINDTDFRNLTDYTDYYDPATWARRRLGDDFDAYISRKLLQTPSPTTVYGNKLNIEVNPPGDNDIYTGFVTIPAEGTEVSIGLNISTATLKCTKGQDAECTTYEECQSTSMAFQLLILNCTSVGSATCATLFPTTLWISITRSNELCAIVFGRGGGEDELPDWFWWVLIALIIFLLILAWLVYRFWWKQKKTAGELGDAEDELDQQQADNEQGFGKDLDVGDVAFNPMATGVPGMNRPADAFGNELHQRQLAEQNEVVDVQAEIFQVRQDYGQVNTGPRHHN